MQRLSTNMRRSARDYLRPEVAAWAATSGAAIAAAVATAILLSGCTTGIEPSATLTAPESLAASQTLSQVAQGASWPADRWWQRYGDPQLDALVDEALAGNPTLKVAQARLARAQAVVDGARASNLPTLDGALSSERGKFTENYIYPPPLGGATFTTNTALLNFGWDLDFWGKNRAAIAAAGANANASQADAAAARLALTTNVTRTWFQLERLYDLRRVTDASIKQREDILNLTRQRVNAGLDTNVELRQAESELPQARVDLAELDEDIALTRNQMAALLGAGPDRGLTVPQPLAHTATAVALPAELPANLIGRRPDLVAARWRVEAASRRIDYAKARFYPDVNLVASAGFLSLGYTNFINASSLNTGVGPALSLPIFEGGALRSNLRVSDADYDAAVLEYDQTLVDSLKDVADQITSIKALGREREEQAVAVARVEEAYDLATQRYKAGLGNYLTVLTAETTVLQQRRIAAELKARSLDLDVGLVRALGGGYEAALPPLAQR